MLQVSPSDLLGLVTERSKVSIHAALFAVCDGTLDEVIHGQHSLAKASVSNENTESMRLELFMNLVLGKAGTIGNHDFHSSFSVCFLPSSQTNSILPSNLLSLSFE